MRINSNNIDDLLIGIKVFNPKATEIIHYTYVGKINEEYIFTTGITSYHINKNNMDNHLSINATPFVINGFYTDYHEACVKMKELFIDLIDHLNKHQFKLFPITVIK